MSRQWFRDAAWFAWGLLVAEGALYALLAIGVDRLFAALIAGAVLVAVGVALESGK